MDLFIIIYIYTLLQLGLSRDCCGYISFTSRVAPCCTTCCFCSLFLGRAMRAEAPCQLWMARFRSIITSISRLPFGKPEKCSPTWRPLDIPKHLLRRYDWTQRTWIDKKTPSPRLFLCLPTWRVLKSEQKITYDLLQKNTSAKKIPTNILGKLS